MVAAIKQPVPTATTTSTPTPTNPTPAVTKSKKRSALFRDMFVSLQEADSSVDELYRYLSIPKLAATELHEREPLLW
eukprot:scaffold108_cov167-Ochromonas_danica.AAC.2